jgi:recombination protein RecA
MSPKATSVEKVDKESPEAAAPPKEEKKEAAPKAAPVVKKAPNVAAKAAESAKIAAAARAAIMKVTGQKPLSVSNTTMPHASTGSIIINQLIGGNPAKDGKGQICPGFPKKRISEVYGAESSGKTTLCIAAAVEAQRRGEVVMYLDFENALHHGYAQTIGLDFNENKLLYYSPTTLEEGLKMLYVGIKTNVGLVVIDSVAAMVTKADMEKKLDDPQRLGELAAAMSRNLPKIVQWLKESTTAVVLINQTRSLISSGGHGDQDNSSGGKALKFYMTIRLKLTRIKSEVIKRKDNLTLKERNIPYGNVVQVKVVKNKIDRTQGSVGEVFIRYGQGLDEFFSVIECAAARKIVRKDGTYLTYGEMRFQGREKFRTYLMQNPKTFDDLRSSVVKAMQEAERVALEPDEIDDDDIISNLQRDLGDDAIFDGGDEETPIDTLVEEEAG